MLLSRLPTLHVLFPDPSQALGRHRTLCRQVVGATGSETGRAGEMLGDAVCRVRRSGRSDRPRVRPRDLGYVLLEVLVPQEFGRGDNVIDLGAVRLGRLLRLYRNRDMPTPAVDRAI
jgi:hypothetical protein